LLRRAAFRFKPLLRLWAKHLNKHRRHGRRARWRGLLAGGLRRRHLRLWHGPFEARPDAPLNAPIVGMAPTTAAALLAGARTAVFAFNASSPVRWRQAPERPIVGMSTSPGSPATAWSRRRRHLHLRGARSTAAAATGCRPVVGMSPDPQTGATGSPPRRVTCTPTTPVGGLDDGLP